MALMFFLFHAKDKTKSKKVWNYIRVKKREDCIEKFMFLSFFIICYLKNDSSTIGIPSFKLKYSASSLVTSR